MTSEKPCKSEQRRKVTSPLWRCSPPPSENLRGEKSIKERVLEKLYEKYLEGMDYHGKHSEALSFEKWCNAFKEHCGFVTGFEAIDFTEQLTREDCEKEFDKKLVIVAEARDEAYLECVKEARADERKNKNLFTLKELQEANKIDRKKLFEEILKIENPYPLDLIANPENPTEEGKFWLFGNKVWNNCINSILEALKKKELK